MPDATILLVEDHDILREGLQILLEAEGYRVLSAVHGLDALQQMETANPDLILSDISMPEMDGFAFFEAVRRRSDWVSIPFIFLTARGERDDIFTSKKLGAEDYLVKPVVTSELVATIRSRLDRSQQLMMAQLEQAYEASLIMLSNAIELRDRYTRGHVERVTRYSMLIAQQLIAQLSGWNSSLLKPLQFGAILHDIGKIYVREDILRKTGRLNREEWDEMRQHTMVGAGLIQSIPYLSAALPIIQHHHERWDGKGYPDGLAREQIPQGARIVSVADSYDAMTTMRVYQPASSPQQAMDEIVSGSGARYDPEVVEAFLSVWQQF
jgi:putative two-component system response regulator